MNKDKQVLPFNHNTAKHERLWNQVWQELASSEIKMNEEKIEKRKKRQNKMFTK